MKERSAAGKGLMARPIAAVLPAEPGWRVVLSECGPEMPQENGPALVRVTLSLRPIYFWAVEPALVCPPRPTTVMAPMSVMDIFGLATAPAARDFEQPVYPLYPLDKERRRYEVDDIMAWVGPDESDEAALRRLQEVITKRTEVELKRHADKAEQDARIARVRAQKTALLEFRGLLAPRLKDKGWTDRDITNYIAQRPEATYDSILHETPRPQWETLLDAEAQSAEAWRSR